MWLSMAFEMAFVQQCWLTQAECNLQAGPAAHLPAVQPCNHAASQLPAATEAPGAAAGG